MTKQQENFETKITDYMTIWLKRFETRDGPDVDI